MTDGTRFCSNCGSALEGDDRFCADCGAPTDAGAPPPPPAPAASGAPRGLSGGAVGAIVVAVPAVAVGATIMLTGSDEPEPTVTVPTTTAAASTSTEAPTTTGDDLVIGTLSEARSAVVQIVTTGTFMYPEGTLSSEPGAGSGFIIDSSGLAVTANHVVTGAATIEVYLDGEDRPRNAFVVGASECSDLAVIDIEGDGYPSFRWFESQPAVGLEIYAAGFPLADPEYTLVEGIVSKERVDGESSWASVDAVIEHTAAALPGNSGGPLITADAEVVGVVYAGNDLGQNFAVSAEIAAPIVERLRRGEYVDSIGVNGEAMILADGVYGIWVYSVQPGSAADQLGVVPGDLVWTMEGADVGADGTMSAYCDVLRSHAPGATLGIQVYRPGTGEILAGQLNGRILQAVFTPPSTVEDEPSTGTAVEYVDFTDSSGTLYLQAPSNWFVMWDDTYDFYGDGSVIGPWIGVAPSEAGWQDWSGPGVSMYALWGLDATLDDVLDWEQGAASDCTYGGREDFFDGSYYEGRMDTWLDCGPAGSEGYVIAAYPPDGRHMVSLFLQGRTDADFDALIQIIRTFNVYDGG